MADRLTRCAACDGRGYFRCECWPGDCICGWDDQDCEDCGGEGWIDLSYDYPDYDPPTSKDNARGNADV